MSVSVPKLGMVAAIFFAASSRAVFAQLVSEDEELPQTFVQGLLAGIEHPVTGLDHLGAIVGIGILAGLAARGLVPLLAFSIAAVAGVALSLSSAEIPAGELLVGLTTVGIGVLVATRRSIRPAIAASLFAVAGVIHGDSLGASIDGTKSTPLLAYLLGMVTVQFAVGTVACLVAMQMANWPLRRAGLLLLGVLVALAGGIAAADGALI